MNAETIDAMLAAGASAEVFAAAWKAELIAQGKATEHRREKDRERQRRHRKSRGVTRTDCDPPNDNILTPGDTPTPDGVGPKPVTKSRGTRLPNDWELPGEWFRWAKERRGWSPKDVNEEAELFANYWQARSGAGACHTNWLKTWQNWVIRSHRPDGKSSGGKVELSAQQLRERAEWFVRHGQQDRAEECRRKAIKLEQGIAA